ncbi:MAG: hypothetical protein MRY79_08655 [Alphaproteobacteria bacterium]|nr:hypothetical protein [Alphaproteobacteria bacterium]
MNKTSVVGLANVRSGGLVPADMTVKAEFCGRTVNVPVNRVQPGNATYTFWPQGTHKPTWQDRAAQAAHKLGVLKLGK